MANIPFLNNAYFSAKVGIGTDSPGYKLDVSSGSAVGARISTTGFTNLDLVSNRTSGNLGGLRFKQDIDTYQTGEFLGLHGGGFDWKVGNGTGGNAVIKMRLDSSGNLGIGTTSPSNLLSVGVANNTTSKGIAIENTSGTVFGRFGVINPSINNDTYIGSMSNNNFLLYTNNSERMRITSGGKVGIGTTNPETKLTIENASAGPASSTYATTASNSNLHLSAVGVPFYNHLFMGIGSATYAWIQAQHGNSNAQNLALNPIGGNVGIGTDSPDAKLELSSAQPRIRLTDTITGISSGSTTGAIDFYTSDASSEGNAVNAKIESYADSIYGRLGLRFFTGGGGAPTQAMTINWVGSVGIGTAGPSSKLQVDGGIQMADDTATASATKVGTMRYRTATDEAVPVTGIELITNGDFATDTDWDWPGTSWAIAGGSANVASATSDPIYQTVSGFTDGNKYRVRFEVTAVTNGYVRVYAYVGASGTFTNVFNSTELEIGFYEGVFEFGGTNKILRFYGSTGSVGGFAGSIDNISVVEVTEEDASYADMCMQTGASTYEWVNIVRNTY